jgi:serine protease Do
LSVTGIAKRSGLVALVLAAGATSLGAAACKRIPGTGGSVDEAKSAAIPPSATIVASPTVGIPNTNPLVVTTPTMLAMPPQGAPMSFAPLARKVEPAVVTIVIKKKRANGKLRMQGLGSGFLIDKKGTILTNNHVVSGGSAIEVVLWNDKTYEGKVLGTDPSTDVALVKVTSLEGLEGIEPIPLGDSDAMSVGDWVVAVGNPLGLTHTVTAGIVSAKGRSNKDVPLHPPGGGEAYFDFIQTDAAINPGNSGGPLLNLKGEAIGINTAINAQGQGLAFAIPMNMIKQMIPSLVNEGRLVRSYLGVAIADAQLDEKTMLRGAEVTAIGKATPAETAGMKLGDVVIAVDGQSVRDSAHLRWLVSVAGVGKKVTLRVVREAKVFDLPVTLSEKKEKPAKPHADDDDEDEDE